MLLTDCSGMNKIRQKELVSHLKQNKTKYF